MMYEAEELWSPAMRKWMRSAKKHGFYVSLTRHQGQRDWAGGGEADNLQRMTDDGALRIIDSAIGRLNYSQPRTIDRASGIVGPTVPPFVPAGAGVNTMNVKVGGQTILNFRGRGFKI